MSKNVVYPSETICFPVLVDYLQDEIAGFEPTDTDPDLDTETILFLVKCIPSILERALERSELTIVPERIVEWGTKYV